MKIQLMDTGVWGGTIKVRGVLYQGFGSSRKECYHLLLAMAGIEVIQGGVK